MKPIDTELRKVLLLFATAFPQKGPSIDYWDFLLLANLLHSLCVLFRDVELAVQLFSRWVKAPQEFKPLVSVDRRRCKEDYPSLWRVPFRPGVSDHMDHVAEILLERGKRNVLQPAGKAGIVRTEPDREKLDFGNILSSVTLCESLYSHSWRRSICIAMHHTFSKTGIIHVVLYPPSPRTTTSSFLLYTSVCYCETEKE